MQQQRQPSAIGAADLAQVNAQLRTWREVARPQPARITMLGAQRVEKILVRDLDVGFWKFCTEYNNPSAVLPQSGDPVVEHFLPLDLIPWRQTSGGAWARYGSAHPSERFTVTVEVLSMPWAKWSLPIAGQAGFLYDVMIYARGQRHIDYRQLMRATKPLHKHVAHLCLDGGAKPLRFTVPACLGPDTVKAIIQNFYDAALNSLRPGLDDTPDTSIQAYADTLPEYVLGPNNPLTFLGPDMPCSFFQA